LSILLFYWFYYEPDFGSGKEAGALAIKLLEDYLPLIFTGFTFSNKNLSKATHLLESAGCFSYL
jgi:hypothetical protein